MDFHLARTTYERYLQVWRERCRYEPSAWEHERKQYIRLLQEARWEEFWFLVVETPELLASILTTTFFLKPECNVSTEQEAEFIRVGLSYLSEDSEPFRGGLLDRIIFRAYQYKTMLNATEKKGILKRAQRMVLVPPGTCRMGYSDHSIFVGAYLVIQALWDDVMGNKVHSIRGATLPVERISWCDAIVFCNRLSIRDGLQPVYSFPSFFIPALKRQELPQDRVVERLARMIVMDWNADGYRLCTDREWEYCALGNVERRFAGSDSLDTVGWFDENSDQRLQPVGQKDSNAFGLYDMSGSVSEWIWTRTVEVEDSFLEKAFPRTFMAGAGYYLGESFARIGCEYESDPSDRSLNAGFRLLRRRRDAVH